MKFLKNVNHIPWKYVIGMNLTVLVLAISFVSVSSLNSSTENRSQAEESPVAQPLTAKVILDPANPPQLINPDISWAKIGDAVVIKGKNLGTIPFGELKLGQTLVSKSNIVSWEPTQIVITVPDNSTTATISLTYNLPGDKTVTTTTTTPLTITDKNKF
jgi:hypothetical protein